MTPKAIATLTKTIDATAASLNSITCASGPRHEQVDREEAEDGADRGRPPRERHVEHASAVAPARRGRGHAAGDRVAAGFVELGDRHARVNPCRRRLVTRMYRAWCPRSRPCNLGARTMTRAMLCARAEPAAPAPRCRRLRLPPGPPAGGPA